MKSQVLLRVSFCLTTSTSSSFTMQKSMDCTVLIDSARRYIIGVETKDNGLLVAKSKIRLDSKGIVL